MTKPKGLVPLRPGRRQKKVGDRCIHGHPLVEGNIRWRPGKVAGEKYLVCLTCKRTRGRETDRSPESRAAVKTTRAYARLNARIIAFETEDDLVKWQKYAQAVSSPHNYLKAKAPDEFQTLNMEFDKTRGLCLNNPDPWDAFDDPRWPDEAQGVPMPTAEEAKALCSGCPVLEQCKTWGLAEKPAWGVVGGIVWLDSKVIA